MSNVFFTEKILDLAREYFQAHRFRREIGRFSLAGVIHRDS